MCDANDCFSTQVENNNCGVSCKVCYTVIILLTKMK